MADGKTTGAATLGLIAGNGKFPFLVLDAARAQGLHVVVAAIKEEADSALEARAQAAGAGSAALHWLSLGELSKLIETFQAAGVSRAVMAGQVQHKQIFSSIRPDWKLAKLLMSLGTRNTDSLIGAVAELLKQEGITLESSTALLEPLLARAGTLTERGPTPEETEDIAYGRAAARHLAASDLGQTVVVAAKACVAIEAMEGTDAAIRRAGELMQSLRAEPGALPRSLTVVKVAKPGQDMRFDVPIVGVKTIATMAEAGATCLALDAGKCLLIDGVQAITSAADKENIAVVAE